jgi:hypothetical protein
MVHIVRCYYVSPLNARFVRFNSLILQNP